MRGRLEGTGIDREELSDIEKKWYDLRNTGYDGPIDHNGNPVDNPESWEQEHR
jgi:hypothetical protein